MNIYLVCEHSSSAWPCHLVKAAFAHKEDAVKVATPDFKYFVLEVPLYSKIDVDSEDDISRWEDEGGA